MRRKNQAVLQARQSVDHPWNFVFAYMPANGGIATCTDRRNALDGNSIAYLQKKAPQFEYRIQTHAD